LSACQTIAAAGKAKGAAKALSSSSRVFIWRGRHSGAREDTGLHDDRRSATSGRRREAIEFRRLLCFLSTPFLELVPLASSILGAAVSFYAISLIARDRSPAIIGLAAVAGADGLLSTVRSLKNATRPGA
jgi:hypothetical protein